jgi:hypothetical protein
MLGRTEMAVTLAAVCALVLLVVLWIKRLKDRQEMEQHSITPEVRARVMKPFVPSCIEL